MPPKKKETTSRDKSKDKKPPSRDKKPASKSKVSEKSNDKKPSSRDKKSDSRAKSRDVKDTKKSSVRDKKQPDDKSKQKSTPGKSVMNQEVNSEIIKALQLEKKFENIDNLYLSQVEYANEYVRQSKMESFLMLSIRELVKGTQLPINPYPRIVRSLKFSLWQQVCVKNYEEREKLVIKNQIDMTPQPYKIVTLSQEKIAYGFNSILERINLKNLRFVYKYMRDYLTSEMFEQNEMKCKIQPSLGGSFFFENELIASSGCFSDYFEVHLHHFIESNVLRNSVDLFLKLIYDDIKLQSSKQSGNLFTKFIIEQTYDPKNPVKLELTINDIMENKNAFFILLEEGAINRAKIYSKVLYKVKLNAGNVQEQYNQENLFNEVFYETKRYYHLHYVCTEDPSKSESFTFHKMSCLLKGFFIQEDAAYRYADMFYSSEEDFLQSENFKEFLETQVSMLIRPWFGMKIMKLLWETYWLILLSNTGELRDEMLYQIQRIFSCSSSLFKTVAKKLLKVSKLYNAFLESQVESFKTGALFEISLIVQIIDELLIESNCPEIYYMHEVITKFNNNLKAYLQKSLYSEKNQSSIASSNSYLFDNICYTNTMILFNLNNKLEDFIMSSQTANNFVKPEIQPFTYKIFENTRQSSQLQDLDACIKNFNKLLKTPTSISSEESTAFLLIEYLEATGVTAKIRKILYNVYFKKKIPNPLPKIVHKMEKYSLTQSSKLLSFEEIKQFFFFPEENISQLYQGYEPVNNYSTAITEGILENNMKQIIGPSALLKICPVENLSKLSLLLNWLDWKVANVDIAKHSEFISILSFSAESLFQNPLLYGGNDVTANAMNIKLSENSVLHVYYDFFLDENDKTYGLHTFVEIICNLLSYLDKVYQPDVGIVPIGVFEEGQDEPVISLMDLHNQDQRTIDAKKEFLNLITSGKSINMRQLLMNQNTVKKETFYDFKLFVVEQNQLFLSENDVHSMKKEINHNDFLKQFCYENEAALFDTFIPFNKVQIISKLRKERDLCVSRGDLIEAAKLNVINLALDNKHQNCIRTVQALADNTMKFHLMTERFTCLKNISLIFSLRCENIETIKSWSEVALEAMRFYNKSQFDLQNSLLSNYDQLFQDGIYSKLLNRIRVINFQTDNITTQDDRTKDLYSNSIWAQLRNLINKQIGDYKALANYSYQSNTKNFLKKKDLTNKKFDAFG